MGLFGMRKKRKDTAIQEPVAMKKAEKGGKDKSPAGRWIFRGLAVSFAFAVGLTCFYDFFRAGAERNMTSPIEEEDNISWLYQNCYLLYRDLYNAQQGQQADYFDLYLDTDEGQEWLLDRDEVRKRLDNWEESESRADIVETSPLEPLSPEAGGEQIGDRTETAEYTFDEMSNLTVALDHLERYFQELEGYFGNLNSGYDYIIKDNNSGRYVTNMSLDDRNRGKEDQYFLLSFFFDGAGNVTVGDTICGSNESQIRKYASEVIREGILQNLASRADGLIRVRQPVDCTVTFAISRAAWDERGGGYDFEKWGGFPTTDGYSFTYTYYRFGNDLVSAYRSVNVGGALFVCLLAVAFLGLFLPLRENAKPRKFEKLFTLPFEVLCVIGICICGLQDSMIELVAYVAGGRAEQVVGVYLPWAYDLVGPFNLLALTLFFFSGWYLGVCARALREMGVKCYIRQRSMIYRFFPFLKGKIMGFYEAVLHLELTQNANRTILKILIVNALILFFISSLWLGGFAITLVYSAVLYLILRKYVSDLQEKYRVLFKAVDEIADGNLNVTITEDLGVFEPFRVQLFKIQEGLKKAVAVEVRSQRIKTELVTNMSHDLKTPLTAIITYVNLLRKGDVAEAQREEYLEILERKSLRLKTLIEDLFEFSKANSQNVTLNLMDVDIMNLVKQVAFEMSDKIDASGLDVRMNLTEEKVVLPLDSQKTYRVYENLFVNIAKYALAGTRVYVNGFRIDDTVVITLKNISAQEITVEASELTERFVRGNASRNTEGSGLGLAIAKSFTELQGGTLELEVDGDLFKVTTIWRIKADDKGENQDRRAVKINQ